jgi:hypothetical protein
MLCRDMLIIPTKSNQKEKIVIKDDDYLIIEHETMNFHTF